MPIQIQGGPAINVVVDSSGQRAEGGAAIPVAVVTDGRRVTGNRATRVIVVTNPDKVEGGPAIPVVAAAPGDTAVEGGPAMRVYVVQGSLGTTTYTDKIKALSPIAYWPMAEPSGATATDESGNGRNGAYTAVALGAAGIGDGRTAATFDGATSYNNVYSASLNGAFSGVEGTIAVWMKVSAAGDWTDGAARELAQINADANNRVRLRKSTVANTLNFWYNAGGVFKSVDLAGQSATGWLHIAMIWSKSGDALKAYVNGAQVGVTQTGLGAYAGALVANACCIGAATTSAAEVWKGALAHAALWASPLSAAQIATLAVVP